MLNTCPQKYVSKSETPDSVFLLTSEQPGDAEYTEQSYKHDVISLWENARNVKKDRREETSDK